MHYTDRNLSFSFDLPDGWRRDEGNLTLVFFGPNGGISSMSEVIQMQISSVLPQYLDVGSRERFMAEPGATVSRSNLGCETNVVVLERPGNSEMSAVHDGIQYSIAYAHDDATLQAVEQLKKSFSFPSREEAIQAIESWNDPHKQAVLNALKAGSPEEARQALTEAGMPPAIQRPGYTIQHNVGGQTGTWRSGVPRATKRWWEFWK